MTSPTTHLFVYGTLMSRAQGLLGREQRARLARETHSLGEATLTGARLYDLGHFPGLVETGDPAHIVHGEVLTLASPAATLAWVDEYEDVIPSGPAASHYDRVARSVRLASGAELSAWVYRFTRDFARFAAIEGGRWR
jgi:gamma-glutamylcyclotransferase (GGCT)/AIG2-like uncharacterized protein YtfP